MEWGLISNNHATRRKDASSSAPSSSTTNPMDFSPINLFGGGAYPGVGNISMPLSIFAGILPPADFSMIPLAPMMLPIDLGYDISMTSFSGFSGFNFPTMPGIFDFSMMPIPRTFNFSNTSFNTNKNSLNLKKTNTAVNTKDLQPEMKDAMEELFKKAKAKGIDTNDVIISSGYRTREQQEYLYATKPAGMAAKPGTSMHEKGKAVDISASQETLKKLGKIWAEMGYSWGGNWKNNKENWHFDLK